MQTNIKILVALFLLAFIGKTMYESNDPMYEANENSPVQEQVRNYINLETMDEYPYVLTYVNDTLAMIKQKVVDQDYRVEIRMVEDTRAIHTVIEIEEGKERILGDVQVRIALTYHDDILMAWCMVNSEGDTECWHDVEYRNKIKNN